MENLVIDRVPAHFNEGLFWGNGSMGSMVYVRENGICFSLDHINLWETRDCYGSLPYGTFQNFCMDPEGFLEGRYFRQHFHPGDIYRTKLPALSLIMELEAEITGFYGELQLENGFARMDITLENGKQVRLNARMDANANVFFIELDTRNIRLVPRGWDTARGNLAILEDWGYARFETRRNGAFTHVLQPFSSDGLAVLSVCSREQAVYVALDANFRKGSDAMVQQNQALLLSYSRQASEYLSAHEKAWRTFWGRSRVTVPDPVLQQAYDLEMYKIFSNMRPQLPPVTLMGIWNQDERMPAWCGDWHNDLNIQACYWPVYVSGHPELAAAYLDYYSAAMPHFEERAWKLYGIRNAVQCPVMMGPGGHATLGEWGMWGCLPGAELFVATDFVRFFEFTRDMTRLEASVYPFVEKVIALYRGIAVDGDDGFLHIPFTNSPEIVRNDRLLIREDSTFFISTLHYLLERMQAYAVLLGKDPMGFAEFDRRLTPVITTELGYSLFPGIDPFYSHRHFCHLYPIFPLGMDVHSETAEKSLDRVINLGLTGYAGWSFPYLAILAARCGRGNMAALMLQIYCNGFRSRNSFCVNGDPYCSGILEVSNNSAGEPSEVFTLEAGFILATAVMELFVHRSGRDVYIGYGIPDSWKQCSCRQLVIEGGHKISMEQEHYGVKTVYVDANTEETLIFHIAKTNQSIPLDLKKGNRYTLEIK